MRLVWTEESLDAITDIVGYIAKDNEPAAYKLGNAILDDTKTHLLQNPQLGRPGRISGTRELVVHSSYIVVYTVSADTLTILTVRHSARVCPGTV